MAGNDLTPPFLRGLASIRPLIALRYRLLWAQARGTGGKSALLVVLYLFGAGLFLLFSLGGAGAALVAARSGRGEEVARWTLACICGGGAVSSLVLGAGPRSAFSIRILRQYPISPLHVLVARHLTGLLDPIWIFVLAAALGLAVGYAVMGFASMVIGLPASILCVVASYLAILITFALVDRLLLRKAGATVLGAVVFGLTATVAIAGPILAGGASRNLWRILNHVLMLTPPGNAASLLAAAGYFPAALLLPGWCALLAWILARLERHLPSSATPSPLRIMGEGFYDRVELLFAGISGPLVAKALRYHLRSNRARFNLLLSIPMMAFLPRLMGKGSGPDGTFLVALALFFCGGIAATGTLTFNQFGYDGAGMRRYFILPMRIADALRAGSIASLLMGGGAILTGFLLWAAASGTSFDVRRGLMLVFSGLAGLLFFNALGAWTTVFAPRNLNF
ncbi:MAG TPA: hypothetical protein VE398_00405, partial [Acidobacteriota bacterium]|nr:hypothetical protein [Acidobacteriota bacterium]